MITKDDLIVWFKALESYKRIDTMCTLLNMCLPFELRFLGTCLEELGRRDSQELRVLELRVNNPQDLATDMIACQKGEPTDKKVRRKMALYLALIRACNRTNVAEIFRTLESWGELDFSSMTDVDTLKEMLLVYTMAANHPVFEFEQHLKFMRIFEKIKENKLVADTPITTTTPPPQSLQSATHQSGGSVGGHLDPTLHIGHQQMQHVGLTSQKDYMPQHTIHTTAPLHTSGHHHQLLAPTPMQMLPQGTMPLNYPQSHLAKLISTADGPPPLQHQITTVDGIPHMISSNITIPDNSNAAILTHPNAASWAMRQYHQAPLPGGSQQMMDHPPQASSPMLSQQSSPASSRATSPNRTSSCDSGMQQPSTQQNATQVRNMQRIGQTQLKNIRRPSAETTPPPPMMTNELIMPQSMKQIQEVVMNNDGTGNQLQNLIRNGYTRAGNHPRIKPGTYIPLNQQQQQSPVNQQHYQGSFAINTNLTYAMQNMSMSSSDMSSSGHHSMDGSSGVGNMMSMNSNKSAGSDSGSSIGSSGEISPPETPTLMMNNVTNTTMRMSSSSGDIQQSQQQQQPTQKHHQPSQLSYNKQIGLTRLNGRPEKLLTAQTAGGGGGSNVMSASTLIYAQPQQQQQQSTNQQPIYANEMLIGPGTVGTTNVMQSSLNNNNSAGSTANVVSSNNNMVGSNTVLISSQSAGGATLGNVISTNSVILQPHQQQYNATYPYHAAAAAAAQHLAATSARPPLMTHNPGMAPPPHNTFRLPGFQLPPNGGELLYPAYHPAGGITFLSGAAPPGAPPVTLRTTNSGAAVVSTQAVSQPPTPQQVPPPPQQLQQTTPSITGLTSPYTSLTTVGLTVKALSCYNCGSQTHTGRECQEASMEDVTRSAIYKLDYSQAATGAGAGTPSAATTPANQQQSTQQQIVGNSASESTISTQHTQQQQQKTHESSAVQQSLSAVTASAVVAASSAASLAAVTAAAGAK